MFFWRVQSSTQKFMRSIYLRCNGDSRVGLLKLFCICRSLWPNNCYNIVRDIEVKSDDLRPYALL